MSLLGGIKDKPKKEAAPSEKKKGKNYGLILDNGDENASMASF